MDAALFGGLALLALIDSTSFGTLVLPLMLLLRERVPHRQLAVYVATIAAFYYALGLGLLFAGATLRDALAAWAGALESTPAYVAQGVLGVGLVVLSYALDPKYAHRFRRRTPAPEPGRRERWRARLSGDGGSLGAAASVALGAGLVEAASMLPYLAAIGTITSLRLPAAGAAAVLAGYVAVMCLPILYLWTVRTLAPGRVAARLRRVGAWLNRHSASAVAWTVGVIGALLALNAVSTLVGRLAG